MDVAITFFWGHRPYPAIETLFDNAQFLFQQTILSLGGDAFDSFDINLYLPVEQESFGQQNCNITLQRSKRRILGNIVLDWQEYRDAPSDLEKVWVAIDAFAEATAIICTRLSFKDASESYRERVDLLKYML